MLGPTLDQQGWARITLRNCMSPEVLWRREAVWIGASLDERDRVLELSLGTLHSFRDVMPRFIVRDRLRVLASEELLGAIAACEVSTSLKCLAADLDSLLRRYAESPEPAEPRPQSKQQRRNLVTYLAMLGPEVSDDDLRDYL